MQPVHGNTSGPSITTVAGYVLGTCSSRLGKEQDPENRLGLGRRQEASAVHLLGLVSPENEKARNQLEWGCNNGISC